MSDNVLLSSLWLLPVIGLLVVLAVPKRSEAAIKWISLGCMLATFLVTLVMLGNYLSVDDQGNHSKAGSRWRTGPRTTPGDGDRSDLLQGRPSPPRARTTWSRDCPWIPSFHIQYYVGVDGISLSLVVLTGLVSVLSCLASWNINKQVKGYFALYLLLVASMMGVFISLDLFLFYVFFEVMLLPMYFLIAIWGGPRREYAAIKFLLYTLFGSVFILLAILILYFYPGDATVPGFSAHSFDVVQLTEIASKTSYYGYNIQWYVFILFFTGFIVKLPSFPFHTWLPDAHVEAPTPISMILAGILLKIGGYGLIRLAWPLAPAGAYSWAYFVAALGVFSILYGALVAMAQTDFKKLVAYSSVSHMGYVTLGLAVMNLKSDPRYLRLRRQRRDVHDAGPRHHLGRHVLPGRRDLRPGPHARSQQAGRPEQHHAALWCHLLRHLLRLDGPAGPLRLRGRGLRRARGVQLRSGARHPGRRRGDPDGRLHPLDHPARLPGPERSLEGLARHGPARNRHRGAAGGPDHRHGDLPPAPRPGLDGTLG